MKNFFKDLLIVTFGITLMAAGIYFFKFPNNFTTGGVSGISVILSELAPNLSTATIMYVINIAVLILGIIFLGKGTGMWTLYGSILLSSLVSLFEFLFPMTQPFTNQPTLELCFSIILPGVGSALLFNKGASTGGTDIIAMILKKYTRIENIGNALLISDSVIVLISVIVFGIETGLFSILGLIAKALVVDNVIENINVKKMCLVITGNSDEISTYINRELKRGATRMDGEGTYTHEGKSVILTVLSPHQAFFLKNYVKSIDPHSFTIITNANSIIGKGFRQV